jgi:hypothetical protein
MPEHERITYQIRSTLIDKLRNHTPSVWDALELQKQQLTTAAMLSKAISKARSLEKRVVEQEFKKPKIITQMQGPVGPYYEAALKPGENSQSANLEYKQPTVKSLMPSAIADPKEDDREVNLVSEPAIHAAKEADFECFNCGRKGHWAANYLKPAKRSKADYGESNSKLIFIKQATIRGQMVDPRPSSNCFNGSNRFNKKKSLKPYNKPRVHFTGDGYNKDDEDDDDHDRADPKGRDEDEEQVLESQAQEFFAQDSEEDIQ